MYWNYMEKESKIKTFSFIEKALVLNKSVCHQKSTHFVYSWTRQC